MTELTGKITSLGSGEVVFLTADNRLYVLDVRGGGIGETANGLTLKRGEQSYSLNKQVTVKGTLEPSGNFLNRFVVIVDDLVKAITSERETKLAAIHKTLEEAQGQYCKISHAEYCRDVGYLLSLVETKEA